MIIIVNSSLRANGVSEAISTRVMGIASSGEALLAMTGVAEKQKAPRKFRGAESGLG
ncbi:MAG: hypothetical protein IPP66_04090 [Anaerolineales bacterium]|nr:hypothetical protein [Anaerolineales bacterium]